jgi:hypothetical protein
VISVDIRENLIAQQFDLRAMVLDVLNLTLAINLEMDNLMAMVINLVLNVAIR